MKSISKLLFLVLLLVGCRPDTSGQYKYKPPEQLKDGLTVASLHEEALDYIYIKKALEKIRAGRFKEIHSLLIYKDGKLVLEEYFPGHQYQWNAPAHHGKWVDWNRDSLHSIMSVTKSITSACVGLAVENGFIGSVQQSIFDFLPEHQHLKIKGKSEITIEHLLTMTSGLDWSEWHAPYSSVENPIVGIWYAKKDPISYILERRLIYPPGTHFSYYGGHQILLGEIIRNATGLNVAEFSEKYLFNPLGINQFDWSLQFPNGVFEAAGALRLRPRDMLKIGILYLDGGTWQGKSILSKDWVKKSKSIFGNNTDIEIPGENFDETGYSYSWWLNEFSNSKKSMPIFYAGGWGGQKIIVIPDLKAVVVFTGGNYTSKLKQSKILEKYILPALKGLSMNNPSPLLGIFELLDRYKITLEEALT